MDKDRIKGAAKQAEGRIQQAKGDLTGDRSDKVEGAAKEVKGKAQQKVGEVKDRVRKTDT